MIFVTGNSLIEKHMYFFFLVIKVKKEASSQADTFSRILVNFSSISESESESERALLPSVFAHTRNLSWC